MSKEAMKLALENICAAKLCEFNSMSSRHEMIRLMDAAITAIREALAEQPAQEPFGHTAAANAALRDAQNRSYQIAKAAQQGCMRCNTPKKCALYGCSPLTWPAEQPAQQDEFKAAYIEAMVASNEAGFAGMSAAETIRELSRMVAEQPARQEPVGRLESDPDEGHVFVPRIDGDWSMLGEDLYTSPQPAQQQEPIAYAVYHRMGGSKSLHWSEQHSPDGDASQYQLVPLFTSPAQRKPLTDEEIEEVWRRVQSSDFHDCVQPFARAIEAAHGIKGDA